MKKAEFLARMQSLASSNGYRTGKKDLLAMVESLLDADSMAPELEESKAVEPKNVPIWNDSPSLPNDLIFRSNGKLPDGRLHGTLSYKHVAGRKYASEVLGEVVMSDDEFVFSAIGVKIVGHTPTLQTAVDQIMQLHVAGPLGLNNWKGD